jgi:uncharacterized protein (DUF58 family)
MSRETIVFIVLLASIVMAAFNSGNNLLYLVSGVMLGTVLVSLIIGRINLSGIKAERRLPKYVFAGRPFKITTEVTNAKKFIRSYGISIEGEEADDESTFFLSVETGGKRTRGKRLTCDRRGTHRFPPVFIRSDFPFGLFKLKRKASGRREMIIYPHIWDINRAPGGSSQLRDEFPTHLKGPGSGLYGFRVYRHGEEATNISWKLSAKLGKLIIRETEHEEKRRVCIVFDNGIENDSATALEAFERAVSSAASLIWYLCRSEYAVKLVTRDKVIGYGVGPDRMHRMLAVLALIEPVTGQKKSAFAGRAALEGGVGVSVSALAPKTGAGKNKGDFSIVITGQKGVQKQ